LVRILLFSVFAIPSGADSYGKIRIFVENNYEIPDDCFVPDRKKIPAYATIRNMIGGVLADSLENAFGRHGRKLAEETEGKTFVASDGKVSRGSSDHSDDKEAVRCPGAFVTDGRIIIARREIGAKTNEIPAARESVMKLGSENKIFASDATHCREKTPEIAKETGNEAIVRAKGNQKTLPHDRIKTAEIMTASDSYAESAEKTRNRTEIGKTEAYEDMILTDSEKRNHISPIVKIGRKREIFDTKRKQRKKTDGISYHIPTTLPGADEFRKGIGGHRGMENPDRYVGDAGMNEDGPRIGDNPHIFSKLGSFAPSIMRTNNVRNIARELFRNRTDIANIFNYRGAI